MNRPASRNFLIALALAAFVSAWFLPGPVAAQPASAPSSRLSVSVANIVRIMTDDQDDTGSMAYMPKTLSLIAKQGVTFTQAPTDIGTAVVAVLDDTCGNLIQLIAAKTPAT